jgi:hypothetical protein
VFFLGTPFAALNWLRMGMKHKAVMFFCVSVIISIFQIWLRHGTPYTKTVNTLLIFLPLLVSVAYRLVLALIMFYDIRVFRLSGMKPNPVNWTIIFPFILSATIVSLGIVAGSDYLAKTTKYCRFPRFQDLSYDNELNARSGLRVTLMNHYDSKCSVSWAMESESNFLVPNQTPMPADSILYQLVGRQKGISRSFIMIYQKVEIYPEPITQAMVDALVENGHDINLPFEIPIDLHHAELLRYTCFQSKEHKNCIIALSYEHVLTWFKVSQQGISDNDFKQILTETIESIDQRIYDYEINVKN